MKQVFSIDVRMYATAYIHADSAEEATAIARGLNDKVVRASGLQFDDANLSGVNLAPAILIIGPDTGDEATAE